MLLSSVPPALDAPDLRIEPEIALWGLSADASRLDAQARSDLARSLEPRAARAGWLCLTTCHRVEAYGWSEAADAPELDGPVVLSGRAAIRHLFRVSAGLESAVLGEDQVLSQLREAARTLGDDPAAHPVIERLAQVALGVGRRARRGGRPRERGLADRALGWLAAAHPDSPVRRILVVGAGAVGRSVAFAARRRGMDVVVATRSPRRLADGTPAIDLAAAAVLAASVDAIVVALGGPWDAIVEAPVTELAPIVDLSAPSAIPGPLRAAHRELVLIDDLFPGAADPSSVPDIDRTYARRALHEVARAEVRFIAWLASRPAADTARRLTERSAARRDLRVERALRRLPDLDDHGREVVRQLASQLVADLLHEPLSRLGRDTDGSARDAVRRLFEP